MHDAETLSSLRKALLVAACSLGLNDEEAEDAAQDTLIKYMRGRSQHQRPRHSIIDWMRMEIGRPGSKRYQWFQNLISIEEAEFAEEDACD